MDNRVCHLSRCTHRTYPCLWGSSPQPWVPYPGRSSTKDRPLLDLLPSSLRGESPLNPPSKSHLGIPLNESGHTGRMGRCCLHPSNRVRCLDRCSLARSASRNCQEWHLSAQPRASHTWPCHPFEDIWEKESLWGPGPGSMC